MVRSSGFGSTTCNYRPLQTRFRFGSESSTLNLATHRNSPARSTKSTRSRLPEGVALPLLVSIWFQVLFHSPPGVLFTFPSRYLSLWVIRSYLALGDGPPAFPRNFSCSMVLFNRWLAHNADYRAFTSFGPGFHAGSSTVSFAYLCHKVFLPRFWALTFSLATTRVIVGLLSLPPGT